MQLSELVSDQMGMFHVSQNERMLRMTGKRHLLELEQEWKLRQMLQSALNNKKSVTISHPSGCLSFIQSTWRDQQKTGIASGRTLPGETG